MEESSAIERQRLEIDLLQAMYPDQIQYTSSGSEVKYSGSTGGSITLRLPETYPAQGHPDIVSATDDRKNDLRATMKSLLEETKLPQGEEVLDALIQTFETALSASNDVESKANQQKNTTNTPEDKSKTVIVWLHHLLNTNKRKLALSPSMTAAAGGIVSGITKPGYPGILVYSGPAALVDSHVAELKHQRWQAFQVRYEQESSVAGAWKFEHGTGIREAESMAEVVQGITREDDRESFLKATGVK